MNCKAGSFGEWMSFSAGHGRKLVGWDEILEGGLAAGAMVMSWRGEEGGIAAATFGARCGHGHRKSRFISIIIKSENTENEPLAIGGFTPVEQVYQYEPVPAALDEKAARACSGGAGSIVDGICSGSISCGIYDVSALCALAEIVWSPRGTARFDEFFPGWSCTWNGSNCWG